jgi:phosphorylcholine metabolism protein LicD
MFLVKFIKFDNFINRYINMQLVFYSFIILTVTLLVYCSLIYYRNNYILPKIIRHYQPLHNRLKLMLPIVITLLNKYNITYWLTSGNLLGYARHNGGFIPWDDDIDLCIVYTDDLESKIPLLDTDLQNYGMKVSVRPFGYAIDNIDHSIDANKAYIDLFVVYRNKDDIYIGNDWTQRTFPNEWYKHSEIFPLETRKFCDIPTNFPCKMDIILSRQYGTDYLKNYRLSHIHHGTLLDRKIVKFTAWSPISV